MLPSDGQHYNSVLAEIIVSNRVGLVHIGLVGDLLSVGARFSMLTISGVRISNDRWIEIAEEAADLEDAYKLAWRMVVSETRTENKEKRLMELTRTLRAAVDSMSNVVRKLEDESR